MRLRPHVERLECRALLLGAVHLGATVRTVRPRRVRVPCTDSAWRLGAGCPAPLVRTVRSPRGERVSSAAHKDDALVLPRLAAALGVVRAEEGVEHVRVRQLRLVELKLDRLGVLFVPVWCCGRLARVKTVPVPAGAHLAVRGIGSLATAVAHACAIHPGKRRKRCLGVPESSERKRRGLKTGVLSRRAVGPPSTGLRALGGDQCERIQADRCRLWHQTEDEHRQHRAKQRTARFLAAHRWECRPVDRGALRRCLLLANRARRGVG